MSKFDPKKLEYETQDKIWDEFCAVIASFNNFQEIKNFLKDLLNRSERMMLARRLQIAKYLEAGKTYSEIKEKMRVGKTTIARVERWLNFGRGGYKAAVEAMKRKTKK